MPHTRQRYAKKCLQNATTHSPIVGIIGQRQTGKTTLMCSLVEEYITLDTSENLEKAETQPDQFLSGRQHPFGIDECQLAPRLFPALKEWVRLHPRKGQHLLTGSVRFTSRKAIRESLTGRIINIELLPFSIAEADSETLPESVVRWAGTKAFPLISSPSSRWINQMNEKFERFLLTGGLPGICFYRDFHIRTARFEAHLETLLERDIRLLVNTTLSYRQLRNLLSILAMTQGEPLNFLKMGKDIGVSAPTLKKLLAAFEGIFLIRIFGTAGSASPICFLEDQGIASYLIGDRRQSRQDLKRGLFSCILPQFLYRPELGTVFYQYRTRGGACVDWVARTQQGSIGFIALDEKEPTQSSLASARSFISFAAGSKVIIAHRGSQIIPVSETILAIPHVCLLSDQWK